MQFFIFHQTLSNPHSETNSIFGLLHRGNLKIEIRKENVFSEQFLFCRRWSFYCLNSRALHGRAHHPSIKTWITLGYPLGNFQISLQKPNSNKKHIGWKLHYFCIDSNKQLCNIENASGIIWGFLKNTQFKCFEISLFFHGLLL